MPNLEESYYEQPWFYAAVDPTKNLEGKPLPVATSLIYGVCNGDTDRFNEACRLVDLFVKEALKQSTARITDLENGLRRIERWFGEFPETGLFWNPPRDMDPVSYAAQYGSNGERDYMREVARATLEGRPVIDPNAPKRED